MDCISCSSNSLIRFGDYVFQDKGNVYQLSRCQTCGLICTDPLPDMNFLNEFYRSSFNYDWYKDHLYRKRADASQRVKELLPYLGKTVLDYGGGFGYFSEACKGKGIDSITYDPHAPDTNRVIEQVKKWDSVVLFHSLEHSIDPLKTLLGIKDYIKDCGMVAVAVPNSESTSYNKLGMTAVWAQPPFLHLYHFNERSLITLIKNAGFEVKTVYFSDRWDANYLCDVVFYKVFRRLDGVWGRIKYRNLRRLYAVFSSTLRSALYILGSLFLKKSLQNQEIVIIAQKID